MSFRLEFNSKSTIEVVCSKDSALAMDDEQYANYLLDVTDKDRLIFKEGMTYENTTRFVMRKVLPFKAAQRVVDQQVSATAQKGSKEVETRFSLKYMLEELRCILVDIKCSADDDQPLEYKKGSDGMAAEELIAGIYSAGVLGDLHTGWQNATSARNDKALVEKK